MKFQSHKLVTVCREQENWSIECDLENIRWSGRLIIASNIARLRETLRRL